MTNIQERVISILTNIFNCNLSAEENLMRSECAEWDSLKHFELIFSLEEEFGVRLTVEQATEINSSDEIIRLLGEIHAT